MQNEIEATFTNVQHDALRQKLEEVGAKCTQDMFFMKRTLFDYEDLRLDSQGAWLRVRQEADNATLCFKKRSSTDIDGMKEVEVVVSNYEDTCEILRSAGLTTKAIHESKRETWTLDGCQVTLDEWPWIPPFAEVEGEDETVVKAVSEKLGFNWDEAVFDSIDGLYLEHFDTNRTEISRAHIFFGDIPKWLEAKRK